MSLSPNSAARTRLPVFPAVTCFSPNEKTPPLAVCTCRTAAVDQVRQNVHLSTVLIPFASCTVRIWVLAPRFAMHGSFFMRGDFGCLCVSVGSGTCSYKRPFRMFKLIVLGCCVGRISGALFSVRARNLLRNPSNISNCK